MEDYGMKILILSLLSTFALPTAVEANWFGDKTFYLSCNKTHHKLSPDGKSNWSDWVPLPEKITNQNHFDKFTLNEEDKSAYLYLSTSEDHEKLDVLIFNRDTIKLTSIYEGKSWDIKVTTTINRNNGEYIQKLKTKTIYHNSPTYSYMKGICKKLKSQKKLF